MKLAVASTILVSSISTSIGSVRKNAGVVGGGDDDGNSFSTIRRDFSVSPIKTKESIATATFKQRRALKKENGKIINQLQKKLDNARRNKFQNLAKEPNNKIDVGALSRNLQQNNTSNTTEPSVIGDLYNLCNSAAADPEFTCACSNLDMEAYTATVSCSYAQKCLEPTENSCKENMTFCFVETYNLDVAGRGSGSSSICYDVTTPYSFSYCYGLTYTGDSETPSGCFLELDGTRCNMCDFSTSPNNPNVTCNDFDCNNVDDGIASGQICGDDTIVSKKIEEYLTYAPLPCPGGCNICPRGGEMTNLDANVTMITGDSYYCYQLNLAGMLGYLQNIPGDLCDALPPIVEQPCGCEGGTETLSPVATSTMPVPAPSYEPAPTTTSVVDTTEAPVLDTDTETLEENGNSDDPVAPESETVTPVPDPESSAPSINTYILALAVAAVTSFRLMLA